MSTRETSESYSDDEVKNFESRDEEHEDEAGPSSRLSRFNRPKVASVPKRRRVSRQKATKKEGKGKGRHFGKLAQLMDMPLDVFFEITSQLEPLDVLQLSRVSKHFRTTFASKNSRHIWVAARKNVPGIPECPPDMSELQFAALMFEHICQACGKPRTQMADYSLRIKFCNPCFKANVKKGSIALRPYGKIPDIVLTLLPRSLLKYHYDYPLQPPDYDTESFEANNNSRQNAYYVPEVEMVVKRYQELGSEPPAQKRFIEQQQAIASEIMNNAIILNEWKDSSKQRKRNDDAERSRSRQSSIEMKLLEMGWDKKYFPPRWDGRWVALVDQPRELTPRIWKVIRPKLEALLEENKTVELRRARRDQMDERKNELLPIWHELVTGLPDAQEQCLMPNFIDACELPTVADMLVDDHVHIPVTEERFLAKLDSILSDVAEFRRKVKIDLVKLLMPATHPLVTTDSTVDDVEQDVDFTILDNVSSLFRCPAWNCRTLIGFPAIFAHEHVKEYNTRWPILRDRMRPDKDVGPTVLEVLKILGIHDGTPVAALEDLDGRFVCMCGHPKFQAPMTFGSLIRHLVDENKWYREREKGLRTLADAADFLLHNDHDLRNQQPCIALLSESELASRGSDENANNAPANNAPVQKCCKLCLSLTRHRVVLTSDAEIAYHMKSKHLKEVNEDDTLGFMQMYDWMREH